VLLEFAAENVVPHPGTFQEDEPEVPAHATRSADPPAAFFYLPSTLESEEAESWLHVAWVLLPLRRHLRSRAYARAHGTLD